jgi:hypothetical protein
MDGYSKMEGKSSRHERPEQHAERSGPSQATEDRRPSTTGSGRHGTHA